MMAKASKSSAGILLAVLLLAGSMDTALAQADADPAGEAPFAVSAEDWQQLPPRVREILREHRRNWNDYPPKRRQRLQRLGNLLLNMPAPQRRKFLRQWRNFKQLTPEQKIRMCNRFLEAKGFLPPPCRKL